MVHKTTASKHRRHRGVSELYSQLHEAEAGPSGEPATRPGQNLDASQLVAMHDDWRSGIRHKNGMLRAADDEVGPAAAVGIGDGGSVLFGEELAAASAMFGGNGSGGGGGASPLTGPGLSDGSGGMAGGGGTGSIADSGGGSHACGGLHGGGGGGHMGAGGAAAGGGGTQGSGGGRAGGDNAAGGGGGCCPSHECRPRLVSAPQCGKNGHNLFVGDWAQPDAGERRPKHEMEDRLPGRDGSVSVNPAAGTPHASVALVCLS